MDTLMVFFTLRNEAVFLKDSAGGPGAAIAGTRSDRQWSEHSRNGSGTGDPRPRRSVTACRRCSLLQPAFSEARPSGRGKAGIAFPSGEVVGRVQRAGPVGTT